jgi:NSS family neurotransmitter:Na+ symporter
MAWLLGVGSALSFNLLSDVTLLPGKTFFDTMDYVSNNIILPLGGMLIALFTGWFLDKSIIEDELSDVPVLVRSVLMVLIKFVAPLAVFIVFVMTFL